MPFSTSKFRQGINALDKGLANEGGWSYGNMVRFWMGSVQPIGGWVLHTPEKFAGVARGSIAWRTLEGKPVLAWGTADKLYAEVDGSRLDITPNLHETTLENIFITENGSPNVGVKMEFHRLKVGNPISFLNHQATVGGLTIEGTYTVTQVISPDLFTITHASNATSTVAAGGGGFVDVLVALPPGLASSDLAGWGGGLWGEGPFGGSDQDMPEMRVWSMAVWGEYGLFNPSGYGLFEFQPESAYQALAFNGSFAGNASGWALGTGWTYGSDKVTKAAGTGANLSQDVDGVLEGGRFYEVSFDVMRTAGSLKFQINAGDPEAVIDVGAASSPIIKSGTYTRLFLCPPTPKDVVFAADAAFAGSIDNVRYSLVSRAYRIVTAPPRIDAMFVDPSGLVIALGTTLLDGTYSGSAYRCSDIGNNRSWVPDTDSLASFQVLRGVGGRLMAGINTSEQNLVWGDEGVLSLRYVGTPGKAFEPIFLGGGCGLISRHSMAAANGFVFWMSNTRQFYAFRGIGNNALGKPETVACPIQAEVFDHVDYRQSLKIHAGMNTTFGECWFFYPDTRDAVVDEEEGYAIGECSRVAVVAWTQANEDSGVPWSMHTISRTSWLAPGTFPYPIGFGEINKNNYLFKHETGKTANGRRLGAVIRSAPFNAGEGDKTLAVMGIQPHFTDHEGTINFWFHSRFSQNGPEITHGPFPATPTTEFLYPRFQGRQVDMEIEWETTGGWGRFGAVQLDLRQTGNGR